MKLDQTTAPDFQKYEVCVTKYCPPILNFRICPRAGTVRLVVSCYLPLYLQNPKSSSPISKGVRAMLSVRQIACESTPHIGGVMARLVNKNCIKK